MKETDIKNAMKAITPEEDQEGVAEKNEEELTSGVYGWLKFKLDSQLEFNGLTAKEMDLTGLLDMTLDDMNGLYDTYAALGGAGMVMQESTLRFAQLVAASVTGFPIEMIGRLKAKDAIKLKNRIYRFFYQ